VRKLRPKSGKRRGSPRRILRAIVIWTATIAVAFYAFCCLLLLGLRWIDPPTTAVQGQRRIEALLRRRPYQKKYVFVPLNRISPHLQHAVIAAEDGRFYQHRGIDWKEVQKVIDEDLEEGRLGRGGSTITQQLVKNLFFTTHRSLIRKAIEFTLAPAAEWILPKGRILELYLNVVEWGAATYGAEAASRAWYGVSAQHVDREQGARLAATLPSPIRRRPSRMNSYSSEILRRMSQYGW
jgi:monofunctional biosynthetic peptidoglycan transglycosylase